MKKKKILVTLLILILFIVLLFPYKSTQYDGTYYYALVYTVVCKNELSVAYLRIKCLIILKQ